MGQLGINAHGEVLEAGQVPDCYLGLLLDPADDGEGAGVLVIAPPALLHPLVPQPHGTLLYELLTGHPDRTPGQLVFLADLTVELRAWPTDTWAKVGVDPQVAAGAVVAGWRDGHLRGLWLGGLTAQEVLALERPAMTYVRAQLGDRLARRIAQAQQHGRPLPNGRRPEGRFLQGPTRGCPGSALVCPPGHLPSEGASGHRGGERPVRPNAHCERAAMRA